MKNLYYVVLVWLIGFSLIVAYKLGASHQALETERTMAIYGCECPNKRCNQQ